MNDFESHPAIKFDVQRLKGIGFHRPLTACLLHLTTKKIIMLFTGKTCVETKTPGKKTLYKRP